MHHKIISKKIFHSFTRYIKYRFTVSSPLFKFHNATRRNSTYPVCNNVSKRWIDFFPNKMLLRICFKISNSCSSTYSWPSNAGKVNAFVISDLKHSTTRGKMCARARANRSSTYFSPHSSIIHFQLYAWLPSRLFFARDTLDSSIRIPDRETWRVLRTARILSVLSTPFTFNPVIIISITISSWKNLTKSSLIVSE